MKVFRLLGGQYGDAVYTTDMINFVNAQSIPVSGVAVAPYMYAPTDSTYKTAASATGGNWPVPAISDWYRHWLKYSYLNWYNLSSQQVALNAYHGPAAIGQIGGKPALIGYETNVGSVDPAAGAPLEHDCYYHPSYSLVWDAAAQSWQDGSPSTSAGTNAICVPSTGLDLAIISGIGGEWGGAAFQFLWPTVIWGGQQAGDGTGNKFATAQGGGSGGDLGVSHDLVNNLVSLKTVQTWWSQTSPPPLSSPAMRVSPSRIPPNQSNPITLRLSGTDTNWNSLSVVTVTNSLTGTTTVTAGTFTAISDTLATLTVTTGGGTGTWKLTVDGLDSPVLGVGSRRKGWFGRLRSGRLAPLRVG